MSYPYQFGLIIGRFQGFHIGHESMIRQALNMCQKVLIFIGSSQEYGTQKNPFNYEYRKEMLTILFTKDIDRLDILPLPDISVGNNSKWGAYVLDNIKAQYPMYPDVFISAKEDRRVSWFDGEKVDMVEVYVPKAIHISGTEMRDDLLQDKYDNWKIYTPKTLWPEYAKQRELVIAAQKNTETASL